MPSTAQEAMPSIGQEAPAGVMLPAALPVSVPQSPLPGPQEVPARSAELAALIGETVARLLVNAEPSAPRQVRLELKGEAYAGVWVSVKEVAGGVAVELVCASEAARQQLSALVLREADAMARRCRRDLQFRVSAGPGDSEDTDRTASAVVDVVGRA